MKTKQILLLAFTSLGMALSTYAQQLKAGNNPTSITANTNFEVEATDGKKVKVNKPDGKIYIENKPTAAKTDSVVMRFTDGELRQMSINRLLGQLDLDGDGIVDAEDPDIDGDGILNAADNCPRQYCQTAPGCPASCVVAPSATVTANCNTSGFTGTFASGTSASGSTYTVTLTNNSFSSVSLTNNISDLSITGVPNVTVLSVSPATLNLNAGQSGTITYNLQGTPTICGTLTGTWTKLSLSCTKTVAVNPNVSCATASWTAAISPAVISGLTNNTSYSGTYSIPYTGGGCTLPAENITSVSGLTLSYAGGTIGASGNLVYNLSGTYTGTSGGSVTFTTSSGCNVTVGLLKSCQEIKTANALATDGVYTIDPDGAGSAFGAMQAQCDMTTDGGGWTMILNYVRPANNLAAIVVRTTLPLLGSSTLGTNESGSTTLWGHAGNSLANAIPFTTIRFFGQTSGHSRIIHFKTTTGVSYTKTGTGSFIGLSSNFTALTGHTAIIPGSLDTHTGGQGNNALTYFPFYLSGTSHWGLNADQKNRWEVDDFPDSPGRSTIHRVWVR